MDILYRGDNKKRNPTIISDFFTDGIYTKARGPGNGKEGCDPLFIYINGLAHALQIHIDHDKKSNDEVKLYDLTQFLSFSSKKETALSYMHSDYVHIPIEHIKIAATHILLEIDISKKENAGIPGLYYLLYDSLDPFDRCEEYEGKHLMAILHVQEFFDHNPQYCLNETIYQKAVNDNEWLLYPMDICDYVIHNGKNIPTYKTRLARSQIMNCTLYKKPDWLD